MHRYVYVSIYINIYIYTYIYIYTDMCIIYIYIYNLTTPHVALRTCLLRRFAHHPKKYQTRVASHHSLHGCSSVSAASLCTSNKKNAILLYLCVIVQFQRCCNPTILRVAPHTCLLRHVARHKKTISQICVSVCGCAVLKKPQSNFAWLVTSVYCIALRITENGIQIVRICV